MKILLRALLIAICFIFSFSEQAETQNIAVKSGHPRIFITPSNLSMLRNRAATTHADTYGVIKSWCDRYWNDAVTRRSLIDDTTVPTDSGVVRYAFIYKLGQIPGFNYSHPINEYGDMAIQTMLDIVIVNSFQPEQVAIAYDWVNERMTATQKRAIVNWFLTVAGDPPQLTSKQGTNFPATPYSFYPGLAFYGDGINDTLAQKYVDFIQVFLDDSRAVSLEAGEAGGHGAGICYGRYFAGTGYHLGQDFYALLTTTNLTMADTFNKYTYMNGFPAWVLYSIQPGPPADSSYPGNDAGTLIKYEDCGSYAWNLPKGGKRMEITLRIMAQVAKEQGDMTKARWITWLVNTKLQSPQQDSTWDIIFNDRTTVPLDPASAGLPLVKPFGWRSSEGRVDYYMDNPKAGIGYIYMKSSWNLVEENTTYSVFKAPPYYYYGHQHFDSLAFMIFKGEPLALPNTGTYFFWYEGGPPDYYLGGVGYPMQWYYYDRTVSANSLLIMDPSEVIYMGSAWHNDYTSYKDGGQRDLGDVWSNYEGVKEGSLYDWGGLIKHENTQNYTYSSADATKGYNSIVNGVKYLNDFGRGTVNPKVSVVQRDYVYLKSVDGNNDYFVVFDRIDSVNPSFKKVFLLHTTGEPILNGTRSVVYGNASNGLFQSDNTNTFTISGTKGKGKLFMKTLLPSTTKVYKMGGKATTMVTAVINNTDGTTLGGPKINVSVTSTAEFPDKPVVVIDNEAFSCDGKTATQLRGCIRGARYYKHNDPQVHNVGVPATQEYAWMIREGDTGHWIAYPHDYGWVHGENIILRDSDNYGRWALRIESSANETHSNFLHVLHPTVDMRKISMAETILVETSNVAGTLIRDSQNVWVVIFSKKGDPQNNLTYSTSYNGNGKHLITGLKYGIYDIYQNGLKILTKQTSKQDTLYFETGGGGNLRLTKTGQESIEFQPH